MSYNVETIGYALKKLNPAGPKYFIPAMQRPFVWGTKDIASLFESIYLGYPIGATLIWNTSYNNPDDLGAKRAYFFPHECQQDMSRVQAHLDPETDLTLILDGQQRLTSLNIGVRGAWIDNKQNKLMMYFDPRVPGEGAFSFRNAEFDNLYGLIQCSDILRWENDNAFNGYVTNFFNANSKILKKNGNSTEEVISKNIDKLRDSFWINKSFCYGIFNAKSIQDALEVFILSNNTGQPLDKSDLIIATLQTSWNNISASDEIDSLKRALNAKFEKSSPFDRKKILKIFLAIAPFKLPISYSISAVNAEIIDKLESYWPKFVLVMKELVNLTNMWGLNKNKSLKSINALIPIAYWLQKFSIDSTAENMNEINNLEKARQWLLIALMTSSFGGNSDQALTATRQVIIDAEDSNFPFSKLSHAIDEHHPHNLSSKDGIESLLESFNYQVGANKISMRLLLMLIRSDINPDADYDLDHIFPKGTYEREYPEFIHKIENFTLLTSRENRIKSNQTPATFWQNDRFNEGFRLMNQLPCDKMVENNVAIYDDPRRFWDIRFKEIRDCIYMMNNS